MATYGGGLKLDSAVSQTQSGSSGSATLITVPAGKLAIVNLGTVTSGGGVITINIDGFDFFVTSGSSTEHLGPIYLGPGSTMTAAFASGPGRATVTGALFVN